MKFPKRIEKGDTIGFVAPSFGCTTEPYASCFDAAQKRFAQLGYKLQEGPNCRVDRGIGKSNTAKKCGDELNKMYCSTDNQALISCGGGELMCEDLEFIRFDKIAKAEPKWYMGYSDNTNFCFPLTTICDVASIYGPCAPSFGMEPWHKSIADAFALLDGGTASEESGGDMACRAKISGNKVTVSTYGKWEKESLKSEENPFAPYHATEKTRILTRLPGVRHGAGTKEVIPETDGDVTVQGRLIGGCMDCLINLVGTKFDHTEEFAERYAGDGILWYLEACDLSVMAMRRAVWQMKNAGWFAHASGFIIGRPMHDREDRMGLDQYAAVSEPLLELGVPVIMDADIGHLPPMMPLINGSLAKAKVKKEKLTIEMRLE